MTVFNFGSINIDYVYHVPHFVRPGETLASTQLDTVLGGKGANQSVALAKAGAEVVHLGRLSEADRWAANALAGFGVDTRGVVFVCGASGHAIIQVDQHAENAILLHGGANQSFDGAAIRDMLSDSQAGDWLLLQNECNCLSDAFAMAKEKGLKLAFNPAPMNDAVSHLPLEQCTLLILNEIEALELANSVSNGAVLEAKDAIEACLTERYPDTQIVLTLGAKGAKFLHGQSRFSVRPPSVTAVDTTGAGDTFVGYLLASMITNLEPQQALLRACTAGALAVTKAGATPSIPASDEVDALLMRTSNDTGE